MTPPPETTTNASSQELFVSRVVETGIRLGLLVLLASWCFQIMQPFLIPIVWGGIIAVASYPGYLWLARMLGGRQVVAATIFTLLGLVLLIVPMVLLSATLVEGARGLAADFQNGTLRIPRPIRRSASAEKASASSRPVTAGANPAKPEQPRA